MSQEKAASRYNYKGSQIPCRSSVVSSSVTGAKRSAGKSASTKPRYTMMTVPNMATMSEPMMSGGIPATQYQSIGAGPMAMSPQYTVQQLPNMYPQTQGLSQGSSAMYPGAATMGDATPQVISPAELSALMKTPGVVMQPQMTNWNQFRGLQPGAATTGDAAPQVISPAELSALMKTPGAIIQPQMGNWNQFGGLQPAMSGLNSSIMYPGGATMGGGATPQAISAEEMSALMKTPGAVMQPQTTFMPSYPARPSARSFIVSCSDGLKILD